MPNTRTCDLLKLLKTNLAFQNHVQTYVHVGVCQCRDLTICKSVQLEQIPIWWWCEYRPRIDIKCNVLMNALAILMSLSNCGEPSCGDFKRITRTCPIRLWAILSKRTWGEFRKETIIVQVSTAKEKNEYIKNKKRASVGHRYPYKRWEILRCGRDQ